MKERTRKIKIKSIKRTRKKKGRKKKLTRKVYKKGDFKSGDGMLTSTWGPALWHTLHCISFNYPVKPSEDDKINYMNFIYSLEHVLPCRYCRENLKNNLKMSQFGTLIFYHNKH